MLVAKADISSSLLSPHFLILPSTSQSLLIKSLAVNELVLPVEPPTAVELPSSAVQQFVTNALDQLETYDTYNPLSMLFRVGVAGQNEVKSTNWPLPFPCIVPHALMYFFCTTLD